MVKPRGEPDGRPHAGAEAQGHPSVVVVGSINADQVVRVERRPGPDETVGGASLELLPGGKGANPAVAAARCGATVAMAGLALVLVTPDGENSIVVVPGANERLTPADVELAAPLLGAAAVLVTQLEIPLEAVARAVGLAGDRRLVVLNCAPARGLARGGSRAAGDGAELGRGHPRCRGSGRPRRCPPGRGRRRGRRRSSRPAEGAGPRHDRSWGRIRRRAGRSARQRVAAARRGALRGGRGLGHHDSARRSRRRAHRPARPHAGPRPEPGAGGSPRSPAEPG